KTQHSNSCCLYFLSSSITNFFVLTFGFFVRILEYGFNVRPDDQILSICKIRYYLSHTAYFQSTYFIVMACIDRCAACSINRKYRKYCNSIIACRIILIIILSGFLSHIQMLIWFETDDILNEFNQHETRCYARKGTYRLIFDMFFLIFYSIGPTLLMSIFGIITMYNIRHLRRQIKPVFNSTNRRLVKRKDFQLILMMLIQILFVIILTFPFALEKFYSTLTENYIKSRLKLSWENLVKSIVILLLYINHSLSFYIYTLSGTSFRKEFYHIVQITFRRFLERRSKHFGNSLFTIDL
ncbi:unnamed protein product, partial [Didymodactylos carnosus]